MHLKRGSHTFICLHTIFNTTGYGFYSNYWCPEEWVNENYWLVSPQWFVVQFISAILSESVHVLYLHRFGGRRPFGNFYFQTEIHLTILHLITIFVHQENWQKVTEEETAFSTADFETWSQILLTNVFYLCRLAVGVHYWWRDKEDRVIKESFKDLSA